MHHHYQDLICLFNHCFLDDYQTELVKGEDEPLYLPANQQNNRYHQVIFAHGYYASALHEIAHWCIAGNERRQLVDYGYWYCPDGRDTLKQQQFEQVEQKPQALEWLFSQAAGVVFHVSCDNLQGEQSDRQQFQQAVYQQVKRYLHQGLPARAQRFIDHLQQFYQTPSLQLAQFKIAY